MNGLQIRHIALGSKPLSWHLARHIYASGQSGKIAIITDRPAALLSSTRKQWLQLIYHIQRERSGTLSASRIRELDNRILWMRRVKFTGRATDDLLEADVTFATADAYVKAPPICLYLCVTGDVELAKLHMLTSWMPKNAEVVLYEQA